MLIEFLRQPIIFLCENITEQHSPLQAYSKQISEWNYHRDAATIERTLISP